MRSLLDVNVLVALAWPNHVHHRLAHRWFPRLRASGWATCPVTQAGFVRVSSNRRVVPEAKSPAEATALLRKIVSLDGHRFWSDDVDLTACELFGDGRLIGHRQVTDAHLLAIAIANEGRLATFDRSIRGLVPPDHNPQQTVLDLSKPPT